MQQEERTQQAVAVFDKHATMYQHKYADVSLYAASLDLFCSLLEAEVPELLELACGPGNITRYLLDRLPACHILGTDLSPNMLHIAQQMNPEASFRLMDCRSVRDTGALYDGLICGFGLPYLSREEAIQLIQDTALVLRPGGICYFSTMEADYSQSGYTTSSAGDRLYLYYHQADYLVAGLERAGFTILALRRLQYPAADGSVTNDLLLLGRLNAVV